MQAKFSSKIKVNATGRKNFQILLGEGNLPKCPFFILLSSQSIIGKSSL